MESIESYIKALIQMSGDGPVELRRNLLALHFGCAPSQINYVLQTRFNPESGYLIESRRGGGGYIRITKLNIDPRKRRLLAFLEEVVGRGIDEAGATRLFTRLLEERLLSERETQICLAAVRRDTLDLPLPVRDLVRGRIVKAMVLALAKD